MATYVKWADTIVDDSGIVIPSVTVTVKDPDTGDSITIYSDRAGTTKSNPFTTGVDGIAEFYVDVETNPRIKIELSKTDYDFTAANEMLNDVYLASKGETLGSLSDVTITSPADNELLAYDSGSGQWVNQTPGEAGVLAADGTVPLAGNWSAGGYNISNVGNLYFGTLGKGIYFSAATDSPSWMPDSSGKRIDAGYPANRGGHFEFYHRDHADRPGEFNFTFGGYSGTGIVRFMHYDGTTWNEKMRITADDRVGILATNPGYTLDVSGDIHCTGKLTSDGGNDPPYVLYNYESRPSIIDRVKKEVPPDKLNGAVLFFNGDQGQLELFLPSKGEFRSLDGKVLEAVEPITQTFETEDRYYLDEENGEIKSYKVKKPVRKYRLKPDCELDPKTGKVKRTIKEKKKNPKTGEEIEEIVGEEEVTPGEAIELVKEDGR